MFESLFFFSNAVCIAPVNAVCTFEARPCLRYSSHLTNDAACLSLPSNGCGMCPCVCLPNCCCCFSLLGERSFVVFCPGFPRITRRHLSFKARPFYHIKRAQVASYLNRPLKLRCFVFPFQTT